MVANVLDIEYEELLDELKRLRRDYADDPEYQAIRAELPADWPM